jgi:hypothetical protein
VVGISKSNVVEGLISPLKFRCSKRERKCGKKTTSKKYYNTGKEKENKQKIIMPCNRQNSCYFIISSSGI